ncbi:hypothetical protein HN014_07620 [Aquimarina sp. TRL1]|uniref:hypothetical protein n=1 Tax=Aquimarina sp. (strain TRL1) TaxID=2736252 RepID=UPI00158D5ECE|nr:hypothetical protein [Aquimarina sp. TRL1]QKX04787.1 hypothetical protein HN014_07620 [Aquimarina sp. TRL1]
MRKIIDIEEELLPKLKLLAALENSSVKRVMEDAVSWYIKHKQKERINEMSQEQKEDLGLLLLMQQAKSDDAISGDEFLNL